MKHRPGTPSGKIINHSRGLGVTDDADIERRAEELARIDGHRVNDDHRRQAAAELSGGGLPATTDEDAESVGGLSRDPSEPPSYTGRQIANQEAEEEGFAAERLVTEGVEEADHEQMLEARKRRRGQDS